MHFYAVIFSLEKESEEHNVLMIERPWSAVCSCLILQVFGDKMEPEHYL